MVVTLILAPALISSYIKPILFYSFTSNYSPIYTPVSPILLCKALKYARRIKILISGPEVIKPFSCSTQLSMKFQMLKVK